MLRGLEGFTTNLRAEQVIRVTSTKDSKKEGESTYSTISLCMKEIFERMRFQERGTVAL